MTLEEAIEQVERMHKESRSGWLYALKRGETIYAERCKKSMDEFGQLAEWLKELQERRKSDNEIPFGNALFSELDSIINVYEVHGNHKKVVELLKELQERRKQPEIIHCGECVHSNKEYSGEIWCGICNGFGIDENSFCSFVERRTDG